MTLLLSVAALTEPLAVRIRNEQAIYATRHRETNRQMIEELNDQ